MILPLIFAALVGVADTATVQARAWETRGRLGLGPAREGADLRQVLERLYRQVAPLRWPFLTAPEANARAAYRSAAFDTFVRNLRRLYRAAGAASQEEWPQATIPWQGAADALVGGPPTGFRSDVDGYVPWLFEAWIEPAKGGAGWTFFQSLLHHDFFDWLRATHTDLRGMTVGQALNRCKAWHEEVVARARAVPLLVDDVVLVARWEDGWALLSLISARALDRESAAMEHCVASYQDLVLRGDRRIFSLQRPEGMPKVTIEMMPDRFKKAWSFGQVRAGHNVRVEGNLLPPTLRALDFLELDRGLWTGEALLLLSLQEMLEMLRHPTGRLASFKARREVFEVHLDQKLLQSAAADPVWDQARGHAPDLFDYPETAFLVRIATPKVGLRAERDAWISVELQADAPLEEGPVQRRALHIRAWAVKDATGEALFEERRHISIFLPWNEAFLRDLFAAATAWLDAHGYIREKDPGASTDLTVFVPQRHIGVATELVGMMQDWAYAHRADYPDVA